MAKENIFVKGVGTVEVSPKNIVLINSTHVDKPKRVYEVWEGCDIGNEVIDLFIIKRHEPWVDVNILTDNKLIQDILEYTQTPENKIVKTFKISNEVAITEYNKDWSPLIIKSANNFYPKEYAIDLQKRFYTKFKKRSNAVTFYNNVISKHKKIYDDLGVSFSDVAPNNIIVNKDFSDFKIIDISSLKKEKFVNKSPLTQIIYGDGANDLRFINPNILKQEWDKQLKEENPITFCISTFNNLNYLKKAVKSVRKNSFFTNAPFVIHAENCTDGTDEWLEENSSKYNLEYYIDKNHIPLGIGGGMNFCAQKVRTEFIMFLHSDFYVAKNWDKALFDVFDKYCLTPMMAFSHRVQPNIFNEKPGRPSTHIVPKDTFGEYYHNFDEDFFVKWADEFTKLNNFEIRKGEGVSGLIRKVDWDKVGGNDPLFAPASWDDMDLFIRMQLEGIKIVLTSRSLVYHFGARGSHFSDDNFDSRSERQIKAERDNQKKWLTKWNKYPEFDQVEFVKSDGMFINKDYKNG